MVFQDYLTKWPKVFAVENQKADTIARLLVEHVVARHGVPQRLLSDRGSIIHSLLVQEVCKLLGTTKVNTYRLDAEPRELRDLVSRGPWAVGVPSAARALLPGPRGSLNRVVPKATHLTILDYSASNAQQRTLHRAYWVGAFC